MGKDVFVCSIVKREKHSKFVRWSDFMELYTSFNKIHNHYQRFRAVEAQSSTLVLTEHELLEQLV